MKNNIPPETQAWMDAEFLKAQKKLDMYPSAVHCAAYNAKAVVPTNQEVIDARQKVLEIYKKRDGITDQVEFDTITAEADEAWKAADDICDAHEAAMDAWKAALTDEEKDAIVVVAGAGRDGNWDKFWECVEIFKTLGIRTP